MPLADGCGWPNKQGQSDFVMRRTGCGVNHDRVERGAGCGVIAWGGAEQKSSAPA
uniref:Uncharacterized protein n=1 Tax=Arundo donax TaxID=35708 RepID=A0A0A9BU44_ARUDO